MNKRNGFTLVELLAVIVVLAIVLIIAVPGVLSIINKTKNSAYDRQIDMIKEATRNYITANSITWNGEDPKSTVVTLEMLQSSGYLDKKILDPRNKQEILCANVLVTKDNKNKINYDVDMECNEVQPIHPRIGSGMIPIVYQENKWVKADSSNKNFAWFNYGDQQWANVATVTEDVRQALLEAPIGTEVPMDKINAMFTWIPRFKYKLFNVDGTISPVGNKNLAGDYMIDIKFETASTAKSTGTKNGEWLTHPAFTFGGQELEGFWVGKFENGYLGATSILEAQQNQIDSTKVIIKPNVYSWRNNTVKNFFDAIQGMKTETHLFGLSSDEDPHMIKNMEWGAMSYLTQSKYGKQGNPNYCVEEKQVRLNTNSKYMTGCGSIVQDAGKFSACEEYNTPNGESASTTGNITGIYDTSGGAWDMVVADLESSTGTGFIVSLSGFDQTELNQLGAEGKYLDGYQYGETAQEYNRGHLGDATIETGPFDENEEYRNAWYLDLAYFPYETQSWMVRGGEAGNRSRSGIMAFHVHDGRIQTYIGSRTVVI